MTRSFKQASDRLNRSKQEKYPLIPGFLGFMVNGVETVEVPTRPGYVFVRLRGVTNEVISAFNDEVSPVYNLPVLVTRDDVDNTRYRVISRDTGVYINWGGASSYLPRHGDSHSFAGTAGSGGDIVWVYGRQMMPLNVIPSGTVGSGNVYVMPGVYYQAGAWKYGGDEYSVSLLPAKPTGSSARMMLLYLDENSNLGIATGTAFSSFLTGTAAIIPYIPNISNNYYVPLAGIRLTSTTSVITWGDIYDLRPWIVGDGFIPTGTFAPHDAGYITVASTSALSSERTLTAGDGISITDNGANNTIVIAFTGTATSGGSGGGDLLIYDDNTFVNTGTAIHFNDNLTVVASGTSVWVNGAAGGGGGSGGGVVVYDNSTYKITGTALSFDLGLDVAVTGSIAYVNSYASNINKIIRVNHQNTTTYVEYAKSDAGLIAAIADKATNDVIFIPPGSYDINSANISDASLIGNSKENTQIYINPGASDQWALYANDTQSSAPYTVLKNLTILIYSEYQYTANNQLAGGIYATNRQLENVHIETIFAGSAGVYTDTNWFSLYLNLLPVFGSYFDRPTPIHNVSMVSDDEYANDSETNIYGLFADSANSLILDNFDIYVYSEYGKNSCGLRLDNGASVDTVIRNGKIYVKRRITYQNNNNDVVGLSAYNFMGTLDSIQCVVDGGHSIALSGTANIIGFDIPYSSSQYTPLIKNSYVEVFPNTTDARGIGTVALLRSVGPVSMSNSYGVIKYDNTIANKPIPYYLYPYDGGYGIPRFRISNCGFDTKDTASPYNYIASGTLLYNSSYIDYYDTHFSTTGTASSSIVSSSAPTYPAIYDDNVFKTTGTSLHFNDNLSVAVTGTSAWIDAVGVTGSAGTPGASGPPGDNTILIYDDGVFKVTGTAIDFGTALDVAVTGTTAFVNNSYGRVLIAENSPTSTGTSFTNIPQIYNSLEVEYICASSVSATADSILAFYNNDKTATNYRRMIMRGTLDTTIASTGADNALISVIPGATAPSNSGGYGIVKINYYTNTTFNKISIGSYGYRVAANNMEHGTHGTEWENTAAINRIDLVLSSGNFISGSKIRLYGIY